MKSFLSILTISLLIVNVNAFVSPKPSSAALLVNEQNRRKIHSNKSLISKNFHNHDLNMKTSTVLQMGMFDQDDGEIAGSDKLLACLPYLLPLLDGDQFARFIYMRIPPLKVAEQIFLGPLISLDSSVPFFGFALFLGLVVLARNTSISRGVRFNIQQAILIDIALIFPDLIGSFAPKNIPLAIVEPCNNFVFYAYASAVGYSIFSNIRGKTPREIPFISEAADRAVGPF